MASNSSGGDGGGVCECVFIKWQHVLSQVCQVGTKHGFVYFSCELNTEMW